MEIVKVQFQNKKDPDVFDGREYSYFTAIPLAVGDVVSVPTQKGDGVAKVTVTDVPMKEIGFDIRHLKTIAKKIPVGTNKNTEAAPTPAPSF